MPPMSAEETSCLVANELNERCFPCQAYASAPTPCHLARDSFSFTETREAVPRRARRCLA